MYNTIVVDDDKLIREDVKAIIGKPDCGFAVAGEANNGKDALDIISTHPVDIVITDIYMPIMNGIELIRKVKLDRPDIKFLVISNYDDFSYVKEAMKLGASDYLLKYEIEESNLISQLETLAEEIEKEKKTKTYLKEQFWRNYLYGKIANEDAARQAAALDIKMKEGNYTIIQIDLFSEDPDENEEDNIENAGGLSEFPIDTKQIFPDARAWYVIPVLKNRWVILTLHTEKSLAFIRNSCIQAAERLRRALSRDAGFKPVITLGDVGIGPGELSGCYTRIKKASKDRFYRGADTIIELADFKGFLVENVELRFKDHKETILSCISANNPEGAVKALQELYREILNKRYFPEYVYGFYIDLLLEIAKYAKVKGITIKEIDDISVATYKKLGKLITLQSVHEYFTRLVKSIFESRWNSLAQPLRAETIKALEFINRSYVGDLSLNIVAEHVGLSKNYFCRLFKEETGENFVDYVNRFRIEKAKFLMETTNCKTAEAADMVGIKDYSYFCKVFKQITGKRTNEFKRKTKVI